MVRTPAVSCRSLWATGRPCSGPGSAPRASASSARAARSSAASKVRVTTALTPLSTALTPPSIAFTPPSTASIRWIWAAMTSRADTSRRRSIPASVTASAAHKSVTGCSLGRLAVPPVGGHPQFD